MARQKSSAPSGKVFDTAMRGSAFFQTKANAHIVREAKDDFRKHSDVRWQPSGARSNAKGCPQSERGGVHQFGVLPKGNANFAFATESWDHD